MVKSFGKQSGQRNGVVSFSKLQHRSAKQTLYASTLIATIRFCVFRDIGKVGTMKDLHRVGSTERSMLILAFALMIATIITGFIFAWNA